VDQSSTYHPQQYYYQSSHFYPYQSQLSLTNTSNDHQQKSTHHSLPLSGDLKNDSVQKKCECKYRIRIFQEERKKIFLINLGNEIEVTGNVRNLSPTLWTLSQLTVLYLNDNQLTRLPSEIACLVHLVILDLSNNKLRNLPSEIGMFI